MRGQSPLGCSGPCLGRGVAGPGKTREESHVISVCHHLNLLLLFAASGIKREHPGDGPSPETRAPFRKADASGKGKRREGGVVGGWRKNSHILSFPANLLMVILSHLPLGIHRELLEPKEMNFSSAI